MGPRVVYRRIVSNVGRALRRVDSHCREEAVGRDVDRGPRPGHRRSVIVGGSDEGLRTRKDDERASRHTLSVTLLPDNDYTARVSTAIVHRDLWKGGDAEVVVHEREDLVRDTGYRSGRTTCEGHCCSRRTLDTAYSQR